MYFGVTFPIVEKIQLCRKHLLQTCKNPKQVKMFVVETLVSPKHFQTGKRLKPLLQTNNP